MIIVYPFFYDMMIQTVIIKSNQKHTEQETIFDTYQMGKTEKLDTHILAPSDIGMDFSIPRLSFSLLP